MAESKLGPVEDYPDRQVVVCDIDGRSVGIFRDGEDFYGFINVCPHRGAQFCGGKLGGTMLSSEPGEFNFGLDGFVLMCPWHRWAFDVRSGETANNVDQRALTMFEVTVKDGHVYADIHSRRAKRPPESMAIA